MAMTLVEVRKTNGAGSLIETGYYISQEYLPHKDCDSDGKILPDQEWQHPDATSLSYCFLGIITGSHRVEGVWASLLSLGAGQTGGHMRIVSTDDDIWIQGRLEAWADRHEREKQEEAERYAQHCADEEAKREEARPILGGCSRCHAQTEQCKGSNHRGSNRCMTCCGGVGHTSKRYCQNCVDLPWREEREKRTGASIIYEGERG